MSRGHSGPSVRVIAPAALVVGVMAAVFLFLKSQPARTAGPASRATEQEGAPADAAHAAAGIRTGGEAGDVAARFRQQVEALEAQLAAAPTDRGLILRLAQFLHDGHRVADALPLYRRAMELDPADPQPYYDLASAYAGLGEWESAAEVLDQRLGQDPTDAVALYDLGAVRANQGRTADARRLLEEAREATTDGALRARISEALARLKEQ